MSVTYIPADLRRLVTARAEGICEYCLIAEEDTYFGCSVDHIVSEKHGGETSAANLAFCCVACNQAKGSDLGSLDWPAQDLVRFYNPRLDRWAEHFKLREGEIAGLTAIGRVTTRILGFNNRERLSERSVLIATRRFPNTAARQRMQ